VLIRLCDRLAKDARGGGRLGGIDDMSPIVSVCLNALGWRYTLVHALHKHVARITQRQIPRWWYDFHASLALSAEPSLPQGLSTEASGMTKVASSTADSNRQLLSLSR
jgi:hypothetical protein